MANYPAGQWAKAYVELVQEASSVNEKEEVTQAFLERIHTLPPSTRKDILGEIQRQYVQAEGGRGVVIELARPLSKKIVQHLEQAFTKKDMVTFRENSELMAGVRVTINGEQELDMSLKRKLDTLFS
jgi:F0F1-type ATP synthase delta subunit